MESAEVLKNISQFFRHTKRHRDGRALEIFAPNIRQALLVGEKRKQDANTALAEGPLISPC
jgi:hypothetical protein